MSDDTMNRGQQDRAQVSGSQDHEVDYFARKHGITADQVRELIKQHGNDRATLEREVGRLKS
jgi:ABC-type microcin C transport system permease subunit YejB